MKRCVLVLLTAGTVIGCQTSGNNWTAQSPPSRSMTPAGRPAATSHYASAPAPTPKSNPDIVPVGYNKGWGSIQNNNFGQKVARAVPSHGGELPGGIAYPYTAEMAAMAGMGAPSGGGGCGHCRGGGCPHCAGGGGGFGAPGPGMMPPIPGASLMPRFATGRSQVRFVRPAGMKIAWQAGGQFTPPQLQAPARYNFAQARIYRLKLTDIPNRPALELYPTLEVYPGNVKVDAYLAHNAVPIEITEEDLDQVNGGNYVTKVIYLPDPKFQELAIGGVETLVSTRLDPGIDPIQEASRRGAILAVLRLGSVDLEMSHSPELFPMAPPVPGPIPPVESADELLPPPGEGEIFVQPE